MSAKNDVTGDLLKSKPSSEQYRDNYDKIFRKKEDKKDEKPVEQPKE